MAANDTRLATQQDDKSAHRDAASGDQTKDAAAQEQAAPRPVRMPLPARAKVKGGGNKARSGKANQGNRSARQLREKGANKTPDEVSEEEEEEEEEEKKSLENFWRYIVTGSYRSRKARGTWGGDDAGE